ncbi:MAG: GNAT family N-acetyltransferase [Halomonas meridiana]|jgi:ribosomal protein S18 acetylase RimI-like enzyme|uniref:N-acetyltransferase n=2 Tax=Halomonadaceae TaxID=28256 RepID=A0ABQ2WI14_9GAMM|nr:MULTISPECIES: GNAT family N-acetyltransferase [Halomonas]GGW52610.1 N-acetyltransferase [Halomonas johnsoniae]MCC4290926.1 GNAT family N-acetyltransferase [Halomonas axialensis]MCD2088977.1 GNAT family N-acetyltransferase [Halomonas meridiana]MCF2911998.1 GNAT family N-acetyltransferase [Halomonas sp. Cn5-12]MCO7244073.1 GNAT family N-acetyltransferase [Halomonas sp. Ps84H-12]|tara:strand:+ start:72 stop:575 length:504 start_codon:yes stop_codon:yes gene_type:complete
MSPPNENRLMRYRTMTINDYEAAIALWSESQGVRLRDADSREGIEKYLLRNPGLSFVAELEGEGESKEGDRNQERAGELVGTIMAGHDGKRGYVQHLSVSHTHRRLGIATQLVSLCLEALKNEGILKSHLMILPENEAAQRFWASQGWAYRSDILLYSFVNGDNHNV